MKENLRTNFLGIEMPNPFMLASAPPARDREMIDRAFKEFYADFDSTFLRLFPTFIDEFNALLTEPARIVPHTEGSLTPALRIYALIRLGVTESASIAKFLRYSNSTIYNYRTRLRNAAACPRDEFEARVTAIGTEKG